MHFTVCILDILLKTIVTWVFVNGIWLLINPTAAVLSYFLGDICYTQPNICEPVRTEVVRVIVNMCVVLDLSSVLSKDGETCNEVDLMLSTLGTSEPCSTSDETVTALQHQTVEILQPNSTSEEIYRQTVGISEPCSTNEVTISTLQQQTCPQTAEILQPNSTSVEINREALGTLEPCSTSQQSHLMVDTASRNITEAADSKLHASDYVTSHVKTFVSVGGSHSVLESSVACHSNQDTDIVPSTSLVSTEHDLDRSIVMTTVLSTSTPLDTDDSTSTRTVPSTSACIVNMERQFDAQHTSIIHGQFIRFKGHRQRISTVGYKTIFR